MDTTEWPICHRDHLFGFNPRPVIFLSYRCFLTIHHVRAGRTPSMAHTWFFLASFSSSICLYALYSILEPHFDDPKQKSWIVTFVAGSVTSTSSLPFLRDFALSRGDMLAIQRRTPFSEVIVGVFNGFLIADLVIGFLCYRQQLSPIFGWVHHISYLFISAHVVIQGWTHAFCVCLVMEMPTWLLAVSSLWPMLRNDVLFATIFLLTRIVLHAILLVKTARLKAGNTMFGDSRSPIWLLSAAFVAHLLWFSSFVRRSS